MKAISSKEEATGEDGDIQNGEDFEQINQIIEQSEKTHLSIQLSEARSESSHQRIIVTGSSSPS